MYFLLYFIVYFYRDSAQLKVIAPEQLICICCQDFVEV